MLLRLPQVAALLNERYKVGDELKRSIRDDILRLIEAKTYRCVALTAAVKAAAQTGMSRHVTMCVWWGRGTPHNAA